MFQSTAEKRIKDQSNYRINSSRMTLLLRSLSKVRQFIGLLLLVLIALSCKNNTTTNLRKKQGPITSLSQKGGTPEAAIIIPGRGEARLYYDTIHAIVKEINLDTVDKPPVVPLKSQPTSVPANTNIVSA
ncbi:MAG: hypothetical protein F6K19_13320, partial [Cyanothece sp. SIO1E1]|nr:hypothetical protein [Cyanothece sp. SIO1E1]